mgnify:CR=1 FL=1
MCNAQSLGVGMLGNVPGANLAVQGGVTATEWTLIKLGEYTIDPNNTW